jgi:hypothetical protein
MQVPRPDPLALAIVSVLAPGIPSGRHLECRRT